MTKNDLIKILPGKSYPLGTRWDGSGVNFSIFSEHATKIELCLFESPDSQKESHRFFLPEQTNMVWHGYLPGIRPGQLYGYRVHGPYAPEQGHRFNSNKVLYDPYAKAIGRRMLWSDALFGYTIGDPKEDLSFDPRDNAPFAPLAAVIDPEFPWMDDRRPMIPWHKTLIYEIHVKGFTKLNPEIPVSLRGTYAGVASDASIRHLKELGVTAVELMPIHQHIDDRHLVEKKLSNYWGYNTLSFFSPDTYYASSASPIETILEFKNMVRELHRAGIEVILDVVYNHTAEGNHLGPTLSLRGIDNSAYYRLVAGNSRYYMDFTGCGNTLNMQHPRVIQLIMDSLRYWVLEMHVDGFRFDLASALARELYDVDKLGSFFDVIHQDPILSQVKLIAEPWDIGEGGYQVGNFPAGWAEWNGKYRDAVRRFWKGDGETLSEFATRLSGSSDLYEATGRQPYASINFITSHDGFALHDLVSYNDKHNGANQENNSDGDNHNLSWNCGAEGSAQDPKIRALREQQKKNLIATLFLSQGVPMIRGGDELSHTQEGNNNAYCQDNEISWLHWDLSEEKKEFLAFFKKAMHFWREQPALKRKHFFYGRKIRGSDIKDITWLNAAGGEMSDQDWTAGFIRCFGVRLAGNMLNEMNERGEPVTGDTLLILMNAHHEDINFMLPDQESESSWELLLDTSKPSDFGTILHSASKPFNLKCRSLALFRLSDSKNDHSQKTIPEKT